MADVVHDMELELVQREMITKSKDAIIEHLREDVRTITLTLKPKQTSFNASVKLGLGACITELRPGPLMDTREVSVDDRILSINGFDITRMEMMIDVKGIIMMAAPNLVLEVSHIRIPKQRIDDITDAEAKLPKRCGSWYLFNQIDRNHDGVLTWREIIRAMKSKKDLKHIMYSSLGLIDQSDHELNELEEIFSDMDDEEGNGSVNAEEFEAFIIRARHTRIQAKARKD